MGLIRYPRFRDLKDPAGASRLILRYEKALTGLFTTYRNRLAEGIRTGRALETTPPPMQVIPEQFTQIVQTINALTVFHIDRIVHEYSEQGYYRGVAFAQKNLKPYRIEVSFRLPYDQQVIRALETRNGELIRGLTEDSRKRVMQEVTTGALNGETVDQISRRIRDTVDTMTLPRARTIARTELMKAVNEGVRKRYISSGVEEFKRVETADERTCTTHIFHIGARTFQGCAALIGQVFTPEEAAELDEQTHPNCRGSWVPKFKGLP